MTVIRRAECPRCGRLRNPDLTIDRGSVCRGPWALNEHEPVEWVVVEYVPAEQLRGAVDASAKVVAAWDAYLCDNDDEDDTTWCALRDAIDGLRGGQ